MARTMECHYLAQEKPAIIIETLINNHVVVCLSQVHHSAVQDCHTISYIQDYDMSKVEKVDAGTDVYSLLGKGTFFRILSSSICFIISSLFRHH